MRYIPVILGASFNEKEFPWEYKRTEDFLDKGINEILEKIESPISVTLIIFSRTKITNDFIRKTEKKSKNKIKITSCFSGGVGIDNIKVSDPSIYIGNMPYISRKNSIISTISLLSKISCIEQKRIGYIGRGVISSTIMKIKGSNKEKQQIGSTSKNLKNFVKGKSCLIVCTNLRKDNKNFLSKKILEKFLTNDKKTKKIILNISRSGVVDEHSIIKKINDGYSLYYISDVFSGNKSKSYAKNFENYIIYYKKKKEIFYIDKKNKIKLKINKKKDLLEKLSECKVFLTPHIFGRGGEYGEKNKKERIKYMYNIYNCFLSTGEIKKENILLKKEFPDFFKDILGVKLR